MATIVRKQPRIVNDILNSSEGRFAGGPESVNFLEAASQSYGIGDLVYLDASAGKVTICTNGTVNSIGNVLTSRVAGIATKAATGTTNTKTHFQVIRPTDILEMNVYHGTANSAVVALTDLGRVCPIRLISGKWLVDVEMSAPEGVTWAAGHVKIIDFIDLVGDLYPRVRVMFQRQTQTVGTTANITTTTVTQILQLG